MFLLIFAIALGLNILVMFLTKEDEEALPEEPAYEIIYEAEEVYVFGQITFDNIKDSSGNAVTIKHDNLYVKDIVKELYNKDITVYEGTGIFENDKSNLKLNEDKIIAVRNEVKKFLEGKEKTEAIILYTDDEDDVFVEYVCGDWDYTDAAYEVAESVSNALKTYIIKQTGISEEYIYAINREYMMQVTEAGEETNLAAFLIKMFAPMLVCLVLYMMVLLNGQSITKAIVAEKTSKLMETLLTSTSPYAVIAGKVTAIATIAIGQMILWVAGAVGGYMTGDIIAEKITPGYANPINEVLEVIREGAATAFTPQAVIIAVVFAIVGFFMYCILAAFAASFVSKAEDLSNVSAIFQLPVVGAFLIVYFAPLIGNDILIFVARYVPLFSPFGIPADVIVGNVSVAESLISLIFVIIAMVVLVIATGKIYKNRIFGK